MFLGALTMPTSPLQDNAESNTMTLTGTGRVTAVPDMAVLRLGVQTTDENLTSAQSENAAITQSVLNVLHQLNITEINTFQYKINKIYDFENGKQIDKGYSVRNILEIKTENTEQVGMVIDHAVDSGANVVEFIDFEISNTINYYLHALNLAVVNAYQKANSIAESLGIVLNPVPKRIHENGNHPIAFQNFATREGILATPIEAGKRIIEANVTIEFTY